jgi:UrcA family protein
MLKLIPAAAALVAASALVLPTVSHAQEANSMSVSYADLDLASRAGQGALQHRIVNAAKVVCVYGLEDSKELALAIETNSCRAGAVSSAWPAYQEAVASARHGTVTVIGSSAIIVTAP